MIRNPHLVMQTIQSHLLNLDEFNLSSRTYIILCNIVCSYTKIERTFNVRQFLSMDAEALSVLILMNLGITPNM